MGRLYRPHVPLQVRCLVAARQLRWVDPELLMRMHRKRYRHLLADLMADLAKGFGCEVKDLRLDHDPPLALRVQERRGLGRKTYYTPDANDPEHLVYRPHGAQFDGSHDVKTRIRGEHGQFSDVVLIKRQRRRERQPTERQRRFAELREQQKKIRRELRKKLKGKAGKRPGGLWPSRPFGGKKSPRRFGGG
jgi:hypothetical protein